MNRHSSTIKINYKVFVFVFFFTKIGKISTELLLHNVWHYVNRYEINLKMTIVTSTLMYIL